MLSKKQAKEIASAINSLQVSGRMISMHVQGDHSISYGIWCEAYDEAIAKLATFGVTLPYYGGKEQPNISMYTVGNV